MQISALGAGAAAKAAARSMPQVGTHEDNVSTPSSSTPSRIDTHHHFFPPSLVQKLGVAPRVSDWTPARSIAAMDENGIRAAIVSVPQAAALRDDLEEARSVARQSNEFGAQMVRDYPGRFGLFAALPLSDVQGSLRECEHAFDVLGADGACLVTSYGNKWPGDPAFALVFDELNRRKAVVFIHPLAPACCANLSVGIQPGALEFVFDTTRAIMSLMLSGTFSRCPDINFIFAHGGGTLPALRERVNYVITEEASLSRQLPKGIDGELQKLYFDVVLVTNSANFALLTQVMPAMRLLLGTDCPFVPPRHSVSELGGLGLAKKILQGIERDNAARLFPRFRA